MSWKSNEMIASVCEEMSKIIYSAAESVRAMQDKGI